MAGPRDVPCNMTKRPPHLVRCAHFNRVPLLRQGGLENSEKAKGARYCAGRQFLLKSREFSTIQDSSREDNGSARHQPPSNPSAPPASGRAEARRPKQINDAACTLLGVKSIVEMKDYRIGELDKQL